MRRAGGQTGATTGSGTQAHTGCDNTRLVLSSVQDTCRTALHRNPVREGCCTLSDRPSRTSPRELGCDDGGGWDSGRGRRSGFRARVYDEDIGLLLQSHDLHCANCYLGPLRSHPTTAS
ncbi:hypothetical protein PsYK624_166360 [Phanerochaete sordida]|uniref:Uncharacterized protein n=1 Tax=Phanerochaete sordida TaxID=48140 RepID=A0A9P3GWW5_9APHY|nr:hypothetical protein PsYK624_166360 [Phanerochaete sordida]